MRDDPCLGLGSQPVEMGVRLGRGAVAQQVELGETSSPEGLGNWTDTNLCTLVERTRIGSP